MEAVVSFYDSFRFIFYFVNYFYLTHFIVIYFRRMSTYFVSFFDIILLKTDLQFLMWEVFPSLIP